jgi:tellurite resistance protein
MGAVKTAKQQRGRPFRKGESGNADGRPKGARNKTTMAVEKLFETEAEDVARAAVACALAGDPAMIRVIIDRVAPPRREATIAIDLPPIRSPSDAPAIAARLIEAVAQGELTPSEAQGLAGLLETYRRQSELADLEARLAALEATNAKR